MGDSKAIVTVKDVVPNAVVCPMLSATNYSVGYENEGASLNT